ELLRPFGPILDFYYPHSDKGGSGYAVINLESNDMAVAAVKELDGLMLGGGAVVVKRAEYRDPEADDYPCITILDIPQWVAEEEIHE
ncbi:hypothetical protein PMAYCL1PPCAC_13804, partial [Pristionchus mayeri]